MAHAETARRTQLANQAAPTALAGASWRASLSKEGVRALAICSGVPPNPDALAADPDLPRLQQKWRDLVVLIRSDFDLRAHEQDLKTALIGATAVYWVDRSNRQKEVMGTGELRKVVALRRCAKKLLQLLGDQKLRNRLLLAEPPIELESWNRLSVDDQAAIIFRGVMDAEKSQLDRAASFGPVGHQPAVARELQDNTGPKKGDRADAAERTMRDLVTLADRALRVETIKPKAHHTALRRAAKPLAQFWKSIGEPTTLKSGAGPSKFAEFLSRCLSVIAREEISEEIAIRACSPTIGAGSRQKIRTVDKRQK